VPERRCVTICGRVQSVYFRETVRRIALRHEVAGFARNVGDDRLEVEAQAEAEGKRTVVETCAFTKRGTLL
jgi:acylphosphatase